MITLAVIIFPEIHFGIQMGDLQFSLMIQALHHLEEFAIVLCLLNTIQ